MRETKRTQRLALDLDHAFQTQKVIKVWKSTIRNALRNQPLEDLHDFLDIHRNIGSFSERLRQDILAGHYNPSSPEFVHLEKRDGIPRRLVIPEPSDALALQCIVEVLEKEIKNNQPSKNSFYSRSHNPEGVDKVDDSFPYPWWMLWPEFQNRIWKFTKSHKYVVVADIANYFDCIPLGSLRNTISSCGHFSENLLNFLFYMLEAFSWRPYYMPHSGVGLPQINFDAPRLLAHAYLFKVDEELEKFTDGDFVRWMDDVDAGVDSREEGKKLLRNLDNVLASQGLRLNANKTKILSAKEAVEYFKIQENRRLTVIQNCIKEGIGNEKTKMQQKILLKSYFERFNEKPRSGQWDKVFKRYLTLFGILEDPHIDKFIPPIIADCPSLRGAAFKYFIRLGINSRRLNILERFLLSGDCEDDVSLFEAVQCLIAWHTPTSGKTVDRMLVLAKNLVRKNGFSSPSRVTASLWLTAKYGSRNDLISLIQSTKGVWEKSGWTARQVAAITPLLSKQDRLLVAETATQNGLLQALEVLAHISSIKRMQSLDKQLSSYLMHQPSPNWDHYPLPKVILAIAIFQGKLKPALKEKLRDNMTDFIQDKRYKYLLNVHCP
ncbi:RNA-directed DNA polymerase [Nodosilinea sp. LEGE 06152]|uniref:RNA-directed DNA polymerase n=1 Tax=Nodosilinea sp. LEGE 06152 TaxID=2777966 RepID=UPI0018826973|nr:RNA-directed DNA polymerase [Nodosilinea sp. LEGE 06152]MBE9157764.1 RNA-directed DNA polymerase [Nodosilinea sp. LEGE 06152]